jgi:hypothetical protein
MMQNQSNYYDAIHLLLAMAETHVDDIESGIEEGIYDADDNKDLDSKRDAIKLVKERMQDIAHVYQRGLSTVVNDQTVPVAIRQGLVHQIVREYDGSEVNGKKTLGGTTTIDPKNYSYPSFKDFMEAVAFLEGAPFAGYIQTYVAEEDGSGPSWITAGVYYVKRHGDRLLN